MDRILRASRKAVKQVIGVLALSVLLGSCRTVVMSNAKPFVECLEEIEEARLGSGMGGPPPYIFIADVYSDSKHAPTAVTCINYSNLGDDGTGNGTKKYKIYAYWRVDNDANRKTLEKYGFVIDEYYSTKKIFKLCYVIAHGIWSIDVSDGVP